MKPIFVVFNPVMITCEKNFSLKNLNTFGIEAYASEYVRITAACEIGSYIGEGKISGNSLVIGGGSNVLFTGNTDISIIHPHITGISVLREDTETIDIVAGCGENWDSFVEFCCRNNYSGLENLSLIPGSVGAAPVQNIGAYGVEVKDRILWVEGYSTGSGELQRIQNSDCRFEYRNSIFKQNLSNSFIITSVAFRLDKKPNFVLAYGNVEQEFRKMKTQDLLSLRKCIIRIRQSKLPDPAIYGNAGSFFKNPVITFKKFESLKKKYPDIPSYPEGKFVKIPAAWLIERTGWKGVREGNTGTWPTQPLVIVNYGKATGKEIVEFSEKILTGIKNKFGIEMEREVRII